MIPMGTVMTVCMFGGLLMVLPPLNKSPVLLRKLVAFILLAAGLWNLLWYASQHLTEFWGLAALVSGALMIITATYTIKPGLLPALMIHVKPLVLLLLAGCAFGYAIKIASL